MRYVVLLISVTALGLTPATVSARQADAAGHYGAKLLICDPPARSATFHGELTTFRGATGGLEVEFILQTRNEAGRFSNAGAPTFGQWLMAQPGYRRYEYDKGVRNLQVGFAYRALVRFRWRGADGAVVAKASRRTKPCTLPAPNLDVVGLMAGKVDADGRRPYTVTYVNDGDADTGEFGIGLSVGGSPQDEQTDQLTAGERSSATFIGPACAAGQTLVATLDPAQVVPESDDADNTYEVPCPT